MDIDTSKLKYTSKQTQCVPSIDGVLSQDLQHGEET